VTIRIKTLLFAGLCCAPLPAKPRINVTSAIVALLLTGCGGPGPDYRLTSVLPSPAVPGSKVVAYGVFPAQVRLYLDGDALTTGQTPNGLRFTIPEWTIAGDRLLGAEANGKELLGTLQVVPRIDRVQVAGQTVTVYGAGWPSSPDSDVLVRLQLDAQTLSPIAAAGQLEAIVGTPLPNGVLTLRVLVGDVSSSPYFVLRESATVTGDVNLPAESATVLPLATSVEDAYSLPLPTSVSSHV
jgi:hypothetical protein